MTDPDHLKEALNVASDAFDHGLGAPTFEPGIDSSNEADEGTVSLQKGCRLIESAEYTLERTDYYTSVVEHSFAAIERTFEGYLILVAGDDPGDFRDHSMVYQRAQEQVPLERATIDGIAHLYDQHRTSTYYGTSVATSGQARALLTLASTVHDHVIGFTADLEQRCNCES